MERGYRLISYTGSDGEPAAGVLIGEHVHAPECVLKSVNLKELSVLGMLRQWDEVHPALDAVAKSTDATQGTKLSDVKLLAPILYPGALYCAGANYWDHLEEMSEIASRPPARSRK